MTEVETESKPVTPVVWRRWPSWTRGARAGAIAILVVCWLLAGHQFAKSLEYTFCWWDCPPDANELRAALPHEITAWLLLILPFVAISVLRGKRRMLVVASVVLVIGAGLLVRWSAEAIRDVNAECVDGIPCDELCAGAECVTDEHGNPVYIDESGNLRPLQSSPGYSPRPG